MAFMIYERAMAKGVGVGGFLECDGKSQERRAGEDPKPGTRRPKPCTLNPEPWPRQILGRGRQKSTTHEGSGFQKSTGAYMSAVCKAKHFQESGEGVPRVRRRAPSVPAGTAAPAFRVSRFGFGFRVSDFGFCEAGFGFQVPGHAMARFRAKRERLKWVLATFT